MRPITDKWLPLLLALVLGVLPVTQALAGGYPSHATGARHHAAAMSLAGHMDQSDTAQAACDHCNTAKQGCSSDCGVCAVTILPEFPFIGAVRPFLPIATMEVSAVSDHPYQLFRPPQV